MTRNVKTRRQLRTRPLLLKQSGASPTVIVEWRHCQYDWNGFLKQSWASPRATPNSGTWWLPAPLRQSGASPTVTLTVWMTWTVAVGDAPGCFKGVLKCQTVSVGDAPDCFKRVLRCRCPGLFLGTMKQSLLGVVHTCYIVTSLFEMPRVLLRGGLSMSLSKSRCQERVGLLII